jgi:hypothetical protein
MQLHIKYLRFLKNSKRTRLACLKYLQRRLIYFHPERPDLLREVEKWAKDLGGAVPVPRLSWKYAWIKTLFGWKPALRTQERSRKRRWTVQRFFERVLFFSPALLHHHQEAG